MADDDPEMFTAQPMSGKMSIASMTGAAAAFQYGLWLAIEQIAGVKGTDDLTWLDELHQGAVREVKGTITEGIPIEAESEGLQFGVDVLNAAFQSYRARLIKARDE